MTRIVEVFTGAYASGKSEISVNRALSLHEQENKKITLVDLDTVEPAYTLRPLKKPLEEKGISVVTQESYFGLGETGNIITTQQIACLSIPGDIVIDVGYGAGGLDILEVIQNIEQEENLRIYIVINTSKPETSSVNNIVEYVQWSLGSGNQKWKKFSGIISNSHFGDDTELKDVVEGYKKVKQASEILNIPIFAQAVSADIYKELNINDFDEAQIWPLKRYMPKAFW